MGYSHKQIAGCFLLAACNFAGADTLSDLLSDYRKVHAQGKISHTLDIDNDTLLLNRNDGFYTSGLRYAQAHTLYGGSDATTFGWRIGQELYTASDIKLPPALIGPPNHPYAGWLYGGFFKEVQRADGTHFKIGIDLGCLGRCAGGEWTQTTFHRILRQPLPKAWDKQVKNELGVILYADIAPVRWSPASSIDITPSLNARFGNIFTDLGADLVVRFGQLSSLPARSSFYGFLRTDVRAIGYNATLQGGYFSKNNPHVVDPKRVVGEAEAGVVWKRGPYGAQVSLVRRGNEIRDLPNSIGTQNYVRMSFFYSL